MRRQSLLSEFLQLLDKHGSEPWFRKNAGIFLDVCDMHGKTAEQHHNQLVSRFIERPSTELDQMHMKGLTASGPPLDVLLRSLEKLRDQRMAVERDDIPSSHADIARLRAGIGR